MARALGPAGRLKCREARASVPLREQQVMKVTELLRTPGLFDGGVVLGEELGVVFARQRTQDLDRIIRRRFIDRMRSHQHPLRRRAADGGACAGAGVPAATCCAGVRRHAIPAWRPTGLNARYHAALRIAELVLRATSRSSRPSTRMASSGKSAG